MRQSDVPRWICCQIGAREHYAIPVALHRSGALDTLYTDLWWPPKLRPAGINRRLAGRFEAGLSTAHVEARNWSSLAYQAYAALRIPAGWPRIIGYNERFEDWVLQSWRSRRRGGAEPVVFAYSYAALELLKFAREQGWRTVLGQIDPGPAEERIVASLRAQEPWGAGHWERAPVDYWESWRKECALADTVMVNSEFARQALVAEGVASAKIQVVPLVLASPAGASEFVRSYPASFSPSRPLRVLFLGQAGLRKGIHLVMRAADLLRGEPLEIHVVGPIQVERTEALIKHPVLRWHGPVPRSAVAAQYQHADVFLFPTFSDGFGLTQLEAQAWKLPVLASRFCGDVVRDGENGLLIDPLSAETIAQLLLALLREPDRLPRLSAGSRLAEHHTIGGLAEHLERAAGAGHTGSC